MLFRNTIFCFSFFICSFLIAQEHYITTIAFYNFENLFDCEDDPITFDNDFLPEGSYSWTKEKLSLKLNNLSHVIFNIGKDISQKSPVIIGFSEVENRYVLEQLISTNLLVNIDYDIVHENSPDKRGIDVGLLYDRSRFSVVNYQYHFLELFDELSKPLYTRDQLCVSGYLDSELIYVIVNHWPSRRGGEKRSDPKRRNAAQLTAKILDSIEQITPNPKVLVMGDFNDNPTNKSFKKALGTRSKKDASCFNLYNPYETMFLNGQGSLAYRDQWSMFDQILLSSPFLKNKSMQWHYYNAYVFSEDFLKHDQGKYFGYPKRTFERGQYIGGYSDHFPVYVYLVKKVSN